MNKNEYTSGASSAASDIALNIITRQEHSISRKKISDNALKVLYKLHRSGYSAYLVGGGVRDILLNMHPKLCDMDA